MNKAGEHKIALNLLLFHKEKDKRSGIIDFFEKKSLIVVFLYEKGKEIVKKEGRRSILTGSNTGKIAKENAARD